MNLLSVRILMIALILLFGAAPAPAQAGSSASRLTVFAAASTTNALTDIAALYEQDHSIKIRLSFASSSTLAKQIEQGAPADVYLSANPKWMNYLEEKGAIADGSRTDLLGNRLVLIAPAASPVKALVVDRGLDLAGLLTDGPLSMGDPDHVPAGMYGKKAMQGLGLWDQVKGRLARAKDVRAALVLVERSEAPLGQVYATDAAISAKVRVVGTFPESSHPRITYPVALVRDSSQARAFLAFLTSDAASAVFTRYGFSVR